MGKILKIIFFITLLVFFPLGEIARIDFGGNSAVTILDTGVGILSLVSLLISSRAAKFQSGKAIQFSLLKPILIFISVCLVSLLLQIIKLKQQEFFVSLLYLVRWAAYAGVYFTIASFGESFKKKISYCMITAGSLVLFSGYLQYFLYPNLRNLQYLGWDVHLYRMFGSFFDPNFFGTFLVLFFIFVLSHVFARRYDAAISLISARAINKEIASPFDSLRVRKNVIALSGLLLLLLFTLLAIYLTYSRSAYLMFLVSVGTFLILKRKMKWIVGIIAFVMVIAVISFFGMRKYHSEGTNLLRVNSTKARIGSTANAVVIFEKNPLLGVGFNAYRYAAKRYGFTNQVSGQIDHGGAGTDNSWLFVLVTTGIVGFISYEFVWFRVLRHKELRITNQESRDRPIDSSILLASAVGLFVDCFFVNSLFYPLIMFWMWMLVGLSEQ